MSSTLSTKETNKIQWCDRCRSAHEMPRCELIYLPRSEGGHIPDMLYEEEDECEVCDTKTKTTIKTYGCMDMSVCKNCEEPDDDDKYDHAPVINSDQLDTALCHDRFNWSFDKPTEEEGKYTTIYITHFEKDQ